MLKVRTLFSGIGSPESALKNLEIPYELVDFCEVDKYAVKSYCAVHGVSENKNLGDITKVWGRNLPYADLLVWGFPCTDISVAGKQAGIVEGETRSGLYYEGLRVLRETKPKYSIIENVKNLTGKKFKAEFEQMLKDIEQLGYNNYWKVLNAKDYGIPQNRERVFIVSIRKDVDTSTFSFPEGFDNGLRLKDFLEDEVDEKYYISQEKTEKLISQIKDGKLGTLPNVTDTPLVTSALGSREHRCGGWKETVGTLCARDYKDPKCVAIPCITPDRVEKRQNGRRFKEDGEPMFTLTSQDRHGILQVENNRPQRIGNIYGEDKGTGFAGNVWDKDALSPTLTTMQGGNREPMILEANVLRPVRTEYGKAIRKQYEAGEVKESRHNMTELKPREDGISNTLTTVQKDNLLLEPNELQFVGGIGGKDWVGDGKDFSRNFPQGNRVYDSEGIACSQTAQGGGIGSYTGLYLEPQYRIRKLTPKECWRLMGFKDEDFQKAIDAGVSNSQLYKQAGNSIVTNCLFYIFKTLLQAEIAAIYEHDKELS